MHKVEKCQKISIKLGTSTKYQKLQIFLFENTEIIQKSHLYQHYVQMLLKTAIDYK